MTCELAKSSKKFNDFSFVMVVAVFILSIGLPIDRTGYATLPLRPLTRVEIDSPDSLSQLRTDIDAGISGEMGVDDFEQLARRTMDLAEGETDQSELLSILRQASRLCWSGPAEQSRALRTWSMNQLVTMSADSSRARTMLRSQFLPPLQRVVPGKQLTEVKIFDHLVDELTTADRAEEFRADLCYAKSLLRVEVNRAWNAGWLDQGERNRTVEALLKLESEYGKLEASGGKTYSEVVSNDIRELKELAFGSSVPEFTLADLQGADFKLKDYRGKVVALIFWSSWCAPCLAKVPEEKEMQSGFSGEPFELIGVNSDQSADDGRKTAVQREMTWRNIWDSEDSESSLGQHFAIRGLPSAIVIDRQGRICGKFVGSIFNQNVSTSDVKRVVELALGKQHNDNIKVADNFGFTRKGEGASDEPKNMDVDANEEMLTAEELNRYTIVTRKLITAINNEDKQAYRALFTDQAWESAIPWFRDIFSAQISSFGRIEKAYAPRRGLVRITEKMSFRGGSDQSATIMVKFEEAIGGALSFELNDKNKIISSNVFIKKELAAFVDKTAAPIFELK